MPGQRFRDGFVLALIGAVLVWQLMIPPVIGIADNGDFPRIMGPFGLTYTSDRFADKYFGFFLLKYRIDPAKTWISGFVSSEKLLVAMALPVNRLFFRDGLFDVRSLGAIHIALLLIAAWLLIVWSRRMAGPARAIFLVFLVLTIPDTGYVAFFNSFYSEPASYVFLLIAMGALLLAAQTPKLSVLLLFLASVLLFVTAKPQNAVLGLLFSLLIARMATLRGDKFWRRACLSGAAIVCLSSIGYSAIQPRWTLKNTYWAAVVYELLGHSQDPFQDLSELGLTCELERFVGRTPFDIRVPREQFEQSFFDRITFGRIGLFYASHPVRLCQAIDRTVASALLLRPVADRARFDYGNFDQPSGRPRHSVSHAYSFWTDLKRSLSGFTAPLLGCFFVVNMAGIGALYFRSPGLYGRLLLETLAVLLSMGVLQLLVVTVTMGTLDPIKQLFLFNVLFDICVAFDLVWLAGHWAKSR